MHNQNSTSSRARLIVASGTRCVRRPSTSSDRSVVHTRQPAREVRLAADRLGRHDLREPPGEPPVVRFAPQRPIQPGRRHLERVRLRQAVEQVLVDVEQRAQVATDVLAVFDADRVFGLARLAGRRPVEHDPQHPAGRLAAELQIENVEP